MELMTTWFAGASHFATATSHSGYENANTKENWPTIYNIPCSVVHWLVDARGHLSDLMCDRLQLFHLNASRSILLILII